MKVRVFLECATKPIFKNYKVYKDCDIEHKEEVIQTLQQNAWKYFSDLEEELRTILYNNKYSVRRDLEIGLDVVEVNIPKSIEKCFEQEELTRLRYETTEYSNNVKESDVAKMLQYNIQSISDIADLLS